MQPHSHARTVRVNLRRLSFFRPGPDTLPLSPTRELLRQKRQALAARLPEVARQFAQPRPVSPDACPIIRRAA